MQRIRVVISDSEYSALARLAERDLRPLADEVRAIVRERLVHEQVLGQERADSASKEEAK